MYSEDALQGSVYTGRRRRCLALTAVLLVAVSAEAATMRATELATLDIEDLMNIKVVSVAKKEQKLSETAAAVFIITGDDIRRSGATTIPEALRLAPGVDVARLDANRWAISIRGFNDRFSNKLLVMIDGRTVYTPLFSGVYWDVQDVVLADVERIEVIRGPGATLWGANAVNGVVNVITKSAQATPGLLVSGGGGTEERMLTTVRYGGQIGNAAHYRTYLKYADHDHFDLASGKEANDDWDQLRGGFRIDWEQSDVNTLTVQGDLYDGSSGVTETPPLLVPPFADRIDDNTDVSGGMLLARWSHIVSETSDMDVQAYYDRTRRDTPLLNERRSTVDVDLQHRFALLARQEVIWGLGYRYTEDDITSSRVFAVDPSSRDMHLPSAFLQDEISCLGDTVRVTIGSKFEHNDYTGFEVQPSVRGVWEAAERQTWWAAVSRAVRTPSRAERDFEITRETLMPGALGAGSPPALVRLLGDDDFGSEELIAYELGYRAQPIDTLSFDVATFFNDYSDLRTLETGTAFPEERPLPPHLVVPLTADNRMKGQSYGVEVASEWRARPWWHLKGAYTYLNMQLTLGNNSTDTRSEAAEGESPQHQFSLRSSMDLPGNVELDGWLRYVDRLSSLDVDSYMTLDVRVAWRASETLELAVVGQNLLDDRHPESSASIIGGIPSEVERGVYATLTWQP